MTVLTALLLAAPLMAAALTTQPAMAQMGGMGGMGGGGMGGMGGGGGMGGRHGGGDMGGPPDGGAPRGGAPRDMKPIPLKKYEAAVESMFRAADANKDGMVTLAEFESVITARRNTLIHKRFVDVDANHDGRIDEGEFIAWESRKSSAEMAEDGGEFAEIVPDAIFPDLGEGERDMALRLAVEPLGPVAIAKANVDYDAGISLAELQAYERARFDKADTNKDLFLSREEIEAMRGGRGMMPPMGGGRGRGGAGGGMGGSMGDGPPPGMPPMGGGDN
ncbi:hypothetical protein FHW96_003231 [Novosphingobium sp. SG751A]|uniref:calcium-binding protein n=1 Tax=Novosphingobium sp. SG751A TaxID=2587000 RepID=UPI0020A6ABA2|nr:calcium-binding protein [Novosphingobium sp. SG751A]NOW47060.1 hypothetical protein [Novosphingobium sp. SG751A]